MNRFLVVILCCVSTGLTINPNHFKARHSFVASPEYQTQEGKLIEVIYPACLGQLPTKIRLLKKYRPELWNPGFKATVQDTFYWGFQVLIQTTDSFKKPKHPPYLTFLYRVFFETPNYSSNYCANGAHCNNYKNGKQCFCNGNFYGPRCRKQKVHCVPNPCVHGDCTELENDYRCVCDALYTGRNCTNSLLYRNFHIQNLKDKNSSVENIPYRSCFSVAARTIRLGPVGPNGKNFTAQLVSNNNRGFSILLEKKQPPNALDTVEIYTIGTYGIRSPFAYGPMCQNKGTCQNTYERQICTCPLEYTGERCEFDRRDCSSVSCENDGTCHRMSDNTHRCVCPEGYGGYNCNYYARSGVVELPGRILSPFGGKTRKKWVTFDACFRDIQPHLKVQVLNPQNISDVIETVTSELNNRGFMVGLKLNVRAPVPDPGNFVELKWTASFPVRNFITNPCQNGGRCKNTRLPHHKCYCEEGFTGKFCETVLNNCQNPCLNGGRCEETSDGFQCICTEGFQGSSCETKTLERLADESGVELVTGRTIFGAQPFECSDNTKVVDVIYDHCYVTRARNVSASAVGAPQLPDTFRVELVEIADLGFRARVVRTDTSYGGWTQGEIDLYWKALFDPITLRTKVCQNGGFCHNSLSGQRCECRNGFSGQFCETEP